MFSSWSTTSKKTETITNVLMSITLLWDQVYSHRNLWVHFTPSVKVKCSLMLMIILLATPPPTQELLIYLTLSESQDHALQYPWTWLNKIISMDRKLSPMISKRTTTKRPNRRWMMKLNTFSRMGLVQHSFLSMTKTHPKSISKLTTKTL